MLANFVERLAILVTGTALALASTACSAAGSSGDDDDTSGAVGGGSMGMGGGTGVGGGGTTGPVSCSSPEEETFSFFLISHEATQRESNNPDGFGGDLGGLSGADAICQRVAEYVSPCQVNKTWRAFLSTSTENAIDRIGQGPWRDAIGRLLANNISELLNNRPINADPEIINDLPNEYGIPNHNPDGTGLVDNHQILTGSGEDGRLYNQSFGFGMGSECGVDRGEWSAEKATCWNWTSSEPQGCPRVGQSWPRTDMGGMTGDSHWISYWNEGGCAPGGALADDSNNPEGMDGTPRVGSAGGYGGWYCFAVMP